MKKYKDILKKYIVSITISEEIEATDEDDAAQKFWEAIENEPQQTILSYIDTYTHVELAE